MCSIPSVFMGAPVGFAKRAERFLLVVISGLLRAVQMLYSFDENFLTTPMCALPRSRQFARFSMTSRSGLVFFLPRDWQSE